MKNIFKYLSVCLVLTTGLTSCEPEDNVNHDEESPRNLGGYAHLVNSRISTFDNNADLAINLFTASGVSVESVEIVRGGSVIGSGTINGETATINTSMFGELQRGSQSIRIRTTLSNGNIAEDPFSISVVSPLSLDTDNPKQATLSGLDTIAVNYDLFTYSATVDNVEMSIKKGANGTYTDAGVEIDEADGTVILGNTNYQQLSLAVQDTLYYRFTATSGSLTQSSENSIVIIEEPVEEVEETDGDETDGDEG